MAIFVMGLAGGPQSLTLAAWNDIVAAERVCLGSDNADLSAFLESHGKKYEAWRGLSPQERAVRLTEKEEENVVYIAERLPLELDETANLLKGKAAFSCPGLLDYVAEQVGERFARGALYLWTETVQGVNPELPNLLWGPVTEDALAVLRWNYPAGYLCKACYNLGGCREQIRDVDLRALEVGALSFIYLPPAGCTDSGKKLQELERVMARLRGEEGCPWDRQQTLASLQPYLIEEAYEVLDAIAQKDPASHCEELGDVLLQIVFQSRITAEQGKFSLADVIASETAKMIRRHPHVFGDSTVSSVEGVLVNWEKIKAQERAGKKRKSLLDGIPKGLPALARAYKVQDKAARVGFQWDDVSGAIAKVKEELQEFKEALEAKEQAAIEEEFGDLLFSLVNVARYLAVYPEVALNKTVGKFERRFRYIEEHADKSLEELGLEEMDKLWDEAKALE